MTLVGDTPESRAAPAAGQDVAILYERLFRIGAALTAELDLQKIVQRLTDEATALCRAAFGAFFYTVVNPQQETLLLYTISGAPPEAFSRFPIPRRTAVFGPTFDGMAPVRIDDVTQDPRFGHNPPYNGLPEGHLPVRSYLALSVISRSGEVLGGLFFGHPEPGIFTELDERLLLTVASHAAIAIDNARLYKQATVSEARFRSLVVATTQIVWTATPSGDIFEDSPSWRAFTGQSFEMLRSGLWTDAIHPDDRANIIARWTEAVQARTRIELAYRLRRIDGVYRHMMINATPVMNDDGSIREFVGTASDVTERHRAEAALRFLAAASHVLVTSLEAKPALEALAALAVAEQADWCTIDLVNEEGTLERVAARHRDPSRTAELASIGSAAMPGRHGELRGISGVLGTGRPELLNAVTQHDLDVFPEAEAARFRALDLGSLVAAPLLAHGRTIGAISFGLAGTTRRYDENDRVLIEDLARRTALAIENARLYSEARDAVGVRDDFLAIAGHELKTPLAALQMQVQGLSFQIERESTSNTGARVIERLGKVTAHIHRIERIINELLDVSRITAQRLDLHREEIDLAAIAEEVTNRFADQLKRGGIALQLQAPAVVTGRWDRMRLEQIVTNLVSNAIKYGAGKPIEVAVGATATTAVLTVEDHGIGISAADQKRIFERFERAVSDNHYGGLGLGLWIVRQIVEALGGRIEITSQIGVGSVFRVELPLRHVENA